MDMETTSSDLILWTEETDEDLQTRRKNADTM